MAQHTSRQRAHLLTCQSYLDAMKSQGVENSITRRAADPAAFLKAPKADQTEGTEKRKGPAKLTDFPMAVRIQALALAEASISYDRIREITGIDAKLLEKLRKNARDRGYEPSKSMQLKEEYVADPAKTGAGKLKKQRLEGIVQNGVGPAPAAPSTPGYVQAGTNGLPPGNWNVMAAAPAPPSVSLG